MENKTIYYFKEISKIPRESYNEEEIANYIVNFAKERNLDYIIDEHNNVIVKKHISGKEPIILQAHIDMVCEKEEDKVFNFKTDSIEVIEKDGYLMANGTTLGADNGVGVAQMLNLLDTSNFSIEAIFTTDEEVNMTGVQNIDVSSLKGKVMINLDGFEKDTILLGCASFTDTYIHINYTFTNDTGNFYKITLTGFEGGHSGSMIDKHRGNSNVLLAKLLLEINDIKVSKFTGGNKLNVIPTYTEAIIKTNLDINSYILPLLFPVDRNTQIDMLSTEIEQTVGKRPRGITMFADIWDSSLVNNLQTCGIEYALLDSNSIPENKRNFLYNIMQDLGKTVEIFPYYNEFVPSGDTPCDYFDKSITKAVEKAEKQDDYFQINPDKIVIVSMNYKTLSQLVENKWFEKFADYLKNTPDTRLKTGIIDEYRKNQNIKIPAYIPTAMNKVLDSWCGYLVRNRNKSSFPNTVYNFIEVYPACRNLYNRITYMTILINQYKNDKMRKKAAREKLLEAQSGNALLCTYNGPFTNTKHRQNAYRSLITAEKFLKEDGKFTESISRFDYTNDGLNEYICRMQDYFAYISLLGGAVQELDVMKNCGNYADNLSRVFEYDGVEDGYNRGILVDHLFNADQFERYINGEAAGDGVFSRIYYKDIKFSANRKELCLSAEAEYKPTHQKVSLRKKYIFTSSGLSVQYILKNESQNPLKLKFAVESNFADVSFESEKINYFNIEVAEPEQVHLLDAKKSTQQLNHSSKLKNVEAIRLTDSFKGVSFGFEPNEQCGYFYTPIIFHRPDYYTNQLTTTAATFVSTLFWDIDIESGKETEKTINFTITSLKKSKPVT